jgi:predicted nucleic acid-binding protein
MKSMSVEFVDTNVLIYASDSDAGYRHVAALKLMSRLAMDGVGAISNQVLAEFYSVATRKLAMGSAVAEGYIRDLSAWLLHSPSHANILSAIQLQRRYQLSWWDAMIVNSAIALNATILWTEDLSDGQQFGTVTVRNPFTNVRLQ